MCILPFTDVTEWGVDEGNPSYPYGARPKMLLISNEDIPKPFKQKHYYLFKTTMNRHPKQFWSEIIAYHLGILMGLDIPKAFSAKHSNFMGQEKFGVLIEWFLKMPKEIGSFKPEALSHGGEWMECFFPNYDTKRGKQHNFGTISTLCNFFEDKKSLIGNWKKYWTETLCFDTIIGNTDRHQDNWGFIVDTTKGKQATFKFTPIFDNGTSLSYEILEENYYKFNDINYLLKYLYRGYHHMKSKNEKLAEFGGEKHFDMLIYLCGIFPEAKKWIHDILPGEETILELEKVLWEYNKLKTIQDIYSLSEEKINFTIKLLKKRIELTENIINE